MLEPFPPKPDEPQFAPPIYQFSGWGFADRVNGRPEDSCHLISGHRLHNPNPPEAYWAYKCYKPGSKEAGPEYAAAWLIAHWWEHYLHCCACLVDDHKPSNFRYALIDTLLFMEGVEE